jgi:outer membrane protein OmpA-like peptidoglycan-associated protein
MSVLIAADRNRLIQLEERLALLESRLSNSQQRCQEVGEILPEALYVTADQTALREALQAPVESCFQHAVQKDPHSLIKAFSPVVVKLIATARRPVITVLRAQQARLAYLNQYLENLDRAMVTQQTQLHELVTQCHHNQENGLEALAGKEGDGLEALAGKVEQTMVTQQLQLSDLQQQLHDLKDTLKPFQRLLSLPGIASVESLITSITSLLELEKHFKKIEQVYLSQQSQVDDLDQYLNKLEQVHVKQQLQIGTVTEQVNHLVGTYQPLETSWQHQVTQLADIEKYLNNLEDAVIRHDTQLEEFNKNLATLQDTPQPLQDLVQKQQSHLTEIETYLEKLEKAHVNQHLHLNQLSNQVGVVQEAFKPMKESLQVSQTQFSTLEQSLGNLEKVQIEQHLQMNRLTKQVPQLVQEALSPVQTALQNYKQQFAEVDQYLDNLEKAHVKQHLELNHLNQQVDDVQRTQVTIERAGRETLAGIEQLDKRVVNIEGGGLEALAGVVKQVEEFKKVTTRFEHMEDRLNDPKKRALDLADILPEAIRQSTQQMVSEITSKVSSQISLSSQEPTKSKELSGEEDLAQSMQRPVEICIQQAIKKDVRPFADALFPLIGPTIRRSINEMFKDIIQRINTMLEQSIFSRQGIFWRLQAWRTGQSFAEIVLSHTLQYRIDQVFLIHRETGLLMLHAHVEEVTLGDRDAVSAMFTAIQDFVRDSFSASKEEELDSVEVGQYTVWIERSPYVILACVIRGGASRTFRTLMKEQLETIHDRYGPLLQQFDGDNTKLKYCQPLIDEMLRSELKSEAQPRLMTPQLAVIMGVLLVSLSLWTYKHFEYQHRLSNYLMTLQEIPGIMVIGTVEQNSKLIVYGMRDPLAKDPEEVARQFKLHDDIMFIGKPYQDLHPQMVEQRLRQWLKPPATVQMTLQGTLLRLKGHADQAWIDKVNDRVWKLAGVTDIDNKDLVNTEAQFQAYLKVLNETPGIMVVSSGVEKGQLVVTGMRDPLAEDPAEIARRMQIADIVGTWRPYQDLAPQFILKRVLTRLTPPATVTIHLEGEVLRFHGHATQEWITKAIDNARTVPGVNKLETNKLITTDQFLLAVAKRELSPPDNITLVVKDRVLQLTGHVNTANFQALLQQLPKFHQAQSELVSIDTSGLIDVESESQRLTQNIEKTIVYFAEETDLMPKQETLLQALLVDIKQLLVYSQELQQTVRLEIIGNADGLGTELHNQQLGQRRAEVLVNWLHKHGIDEKLMNATVPPKIRFGETQPNPNDRNAVFQVRKAQ